MYRTGEIQIASTSRVGGCQLPTVLCTMMNYTICMNNMCDCDCVHNTYVVLLRVYCTGFKSISRDFIFQFNFQCRDSGGIIDFYVRCVYCTHLLGRPYAIRYVPEQRLSWEMRLRGEAKRSSNTCY